MSILKYFKYDHLPPKLQETSRVFCELAHYVFDELPECEEKQVVLRKLLEAKDAAVRARLEE